MNGKLSSISKLSALTLALGATIYTPAASAEGDELIDAKVVDVQYAGGTNVTVRWETYDWDEDSYEPQRAIYLDSILQNDRIYRRYSLFARQPGGDYFLVKDLGETTDRTWSGQIPGLDENNPLQVQVREQHLDNSNYSEGLQAPGKVIDTSDVDHPPSFEHNGDLSNIDFAPNPFGGGSWLYSVDDWAFNYSDGDDGTQKSLYDRVYQSPGIFASLDDYKPGLISLATFNNPYPADGFVVFKTCDLNRYTVQGWIGACSAEYPVVLRSKRHPEHANYPSFTMGNSISVGDDYSLQEIPNWATNVTAGDNATNPSLLFHTLWVTNSALFEIGPWISLPSRTLRFKFKEGASGTSKMYVALADWSEHSPENTQVGVSTRDINTLDIAPDHSSIQTIEFNVGSNTQNKSISNGSRGAEMQGIPASDEELTASEGGGGAAGLALLSLGLLSFSRRK